MPGNEATSQIKDKLDIVDFLRNYLTLLPAGRNFKAICPFHREKTPSFMVSPERQSWHCFGACNTGGDIFTFLMRYENIEFFEALKILAERTGIELRRIDPVIAKQFGALYDIHVTAKNFYRGELAKNDAVLNYALGRGLTEETLEVFELGFAPMGRDALTVFLLNQGFHINDIERSGLSVRGDRGGFYDRFRGRLVFPFYDHLGKVVGFTGRILPAYDDSLAGSGQAPSTGSGQAGIIAKYINSPETPIFRKSRLLYGFDKAKPAIRETKAAFLVEGQMDCLLAFQDGVKNVIATSGTALTEDHLMFLRRYAETVFLCFDRDEAGGNAIERAIDLAGAYDFEARVVVLPGGAKDPAEYVNSNPGKLSQVIQGAVPAMDFYFSRYLSTVADKKNIRVVLAKIRSLKSAIDRARAVKALSEYTQISERDLLEEFDRADISGRNQAVDLSLKESQTSSSFKERRSLIAESLIRLAIQKNDFRITEEAREYLPEFYQKILDALTTDKTTPDLQKAIELLTLQSGFVLVHSGEDLLRELKFEYLISEKQNLAENIRKLDRNGDVRELNAALRKFAVLSQEIHNLKR